MRLCLPFPFVFEADVVSRAEFAIGSCAHDTSDRFAVHDLMLDSESRAKWINGLAVRIDLKVDDAGVMSRLDHLLDFTLGGGRIVLKHAAGLVPDHFDSIFGEGDRQKSGLKPPHPDCAKGDRNCQHAND